jgi:nucleoside-diphosphate-sugar epimerase
MDYFFHPHQTSKYLTTTAVNIDFDKRSALVVEGTLDDQIVYTSVEDIANVVTAAIDHKDEWPTIGGICGDRVTIRQLLEIGEKVRGTFT